jgi:Protein of unknown function (DUF3348)
MEKVPQHMGLGNSKLVRLLAPMAGMTKAAPPSQTPGFDLQLSQCLAWTDAVALAGALDGVALQRPGLSDGAAQVLAQVAQVRADLSQALSNLGVSAARQHRPVDTRVAVTAAQEEEAADFSLQRRHIQQQQHAMGLAIGGLRARLRTVLTGCSPALARLSAVDAVMEQALRPQVQRLICSVPVLLERHFRRLSEAQSQAWLETYRKDQREVLLAELDFRFQPIEGLMAALAFVQADALQTT